MAKRKSDIDSGMFKDVPLVFSDRLTERIWQPKEGLRFKLRALSVRERLYAESSLVQGGTPELMLRIGIVGIEQDGFKPEWEQMAVLDDPVKILSLHTLESIPSILIPTLLKLIDLLTSLSADEVDKLGFFLPCESVT